MKDSVNVVLFSGGRGTATISEALLRYKQLSLTILVNAYDDGLSTGLLRQFIPGMLGPSDIRKNVSRLICSTDRSDDALKYLLEYRFPEETTYEQAVEALREVQALSPPVAVPALAGALKDLSLSRAQRSAEVVGRFLEYCGERLAAGDRFDFGDCSFGNILFSGFFLSCGSDFNRAIESFSEFCGIQAQVINVNDGENLCLAGVKEDGVLLRTEADIVSPQNSSSVQEIFLLNRAIGDAQFEQMKTMKKEDLLAKLRSDSVSAKANPAAVRALADADIIIYGPGTQHSSLLPSYLTTEIAETIAANRNAEKIFIGNILKDHEIQNETANSLARKFLFYMNRKGQVSFSSKDIVSKFFFQSNDPTLEKKGDYVRFVENDKILMESEIVLTDWEVKSGMHSGGRVVDELIGIVNAKFQAGVKRLAHMVSIVVPGLDESKTVKKVLHDLSILDLQSMGLGKEIIFVDGGSVDGTAELAASQPDVKVFRLKRGSGRGEALRLGVEKASGNITVFFPCDAEYDPKDLLPIIPVLVNSEFPAVFGSRTIKCVNVSSRIQEIYKGNRLGYWISKYGGILIGVLGLFLYNRFVSDPLTGIKAFDTRVLKSLGLRAKGVDLETELIAKLLARGSFIFELPVDYRPRLKTEGKKTTVFEGIKALFALIRYKIPSNEKALDYNTSLQ